MKKVWREFMGGPQPWYCPDCRHKLQKMADAKRAWKRKKKQKDVTG